MAYPTQGVSAHTKQNIRLYPPLRTTRAQPLAGRAQPGGQLAGERGRSGPERGYAASERGHAQPPDVAFTRPEQPLHLVSLGLTPDPRQRIVLGVARSNRDAQHVPPRLNSPAWNGPQDHSTRPTTTRMRQLREPPYRSNGGESRWP